MCEWEYMCVSETEWVSVSEWVNEKEMKEKEATHRLEIKKNTRKKVIDNLDK